MSKRVYISADYSQYNGDRDVVEELQKWGNDSLHKVDFIDMSSVAAGSVASDPDCRICDLKAEFNRQLSYLLSGIRLEAERLVNIVRGLSWRHATEFNNVNHCLHPWKRTLCFYTPRSFSSFRPLFGGVFCPPL